MRRHCFLSGITFIEQGLGKLHDDQESCEYVVFNSWRLMSCCCTMAKTASAFDKDSVWTDVSIGVCALVALALPITAFVLERYGPERAVFSAFRLQQESGNSQDNGCSRHSVDVFIRYSGPANVALSLLGCPPNMS